LRADREEELTGSPPPVDTILFDAGGTLVFPGGVRVAGLMGSGHPDSAARLAHSWYHAIYAYDELLLATGGDWRGRPQDKRWVWFWNRMAEAAGLPRVSEATTERLVPENRERPLH
jgi:hypothetical protein